MGLIGAGKFGAMFLAQARHCEGLRVAAVADLRVEAARETLLRTGWPAEAVERASSAFVVVVRRSNRS